MAQYCFCHGWWLDGSYNEHTCKKRENCQYYMEDFYLVHRHHLDDFEELLPFAPCPYYLPRKEETVRDASGEQDIFAT